ncbi:HdeA/HdeB family chaperone [Methylocapsa palsarum]|uniref:HdeA/HdeB family protein n=1 Tax=Methylocapsa palsarum TaxID=1612308 RepID=A0A1I4B5V9_9HYPH|nr:HdeA/HdeB family chaperone [Methylocapsa palsarum]SFK64292.1 HdeA/HdeB family protein [Methylocapsa palsarum]
MTKIFSTILCVIGTSALAVISLTSTVQAKKAGDWTCEDFLQLSDAAKSRVVYWLVGLNKQEMKEAPNITAKDFGIPVSKVVQYCHQNRPANLWDAIVARFYWRAMQIP